jgi:hypothetical protein
MCSIHMNRKIFINTILVRWVIRKSFQALWSAPHWKSISLSQLFKTTKWNAYFKISVKLNHKIYFQFPNGLFNFGSTCYTEVYSSPVERAALKINISLSQYNFIHKLNHSNNQHKRLNHKIKIFNQKQFPNGILKSSSLCQYGSLLKP